jgi:serine protease Do
MKIRALVAVLALMLATAVSLKAETTDPSESRLALPMAEIEEVITGWLDQNGYQIWRVGESHQRVELVGEKPGSHLSLSLIPQSPLATRVVIDSSGSINPHQADQLRRYLMAYIGLPGSTSSLSTGEIPELVRQQVEAVVCIYSDDGKSDVQLSGFIIDTQGLVVCTAHDLKSKQAVTLLLQNGHETVGHVVKLDSASDLALIQAHGPLPASIVLRDGRYLLRNGDSLFAVTCPMNGVSGIHAGTLDGPPRRVEGMLLWQAQMHVDHGSSGSPVFDGHGRLTAVVKGRYRGTDSIGFLIPFETILQFLGKY